MYFVLEYEWINAVNQQNKHIFINIQIEKSHHVATKILFTYILLINCLFVYIFPIDNFVKNNLHQIVLYCQNEICYDFLKFKTMHLNPDLTWPSREKYYLKVLALVCEYDRELCSEYVLTCNSAAKAAFCCSKYKLTTLRLDPSNKLYDYKSVRLANSTQKDYVFVEWFQNHKWDLSVTMYGQTGRPCCLVQHSRRE